MYGLENPESGLDDAPLAHFHNDDTFGTVLNRLFQRAIAGLSLTACGGETRGYLNLKHTLRYVNLAITQPLEPSNLRILSQFTEVSP